MYLVVQLWMGEKYDSRWIRPRLAVHGRFHFSLHAYEHLEVHPLGLATRTEPACGAHVSLINLSLAYERMRWERDNAIAVLEHNMGVANKAARSFQRERDQIIRKLREKHSCIEIAEQFGLTRQRVHQILNEAEQPRTA